MARDDFPKSVKEAVAKRAAYLCSRPDCRVPTIGPHTDPSKASSVGLAAHITAAARGGPRYDPSLTAPQRSAPDNAIWLCALHGREVDTDPPRYTVHELRAWKAMAERDAANALGQTVSSPTADAATSVSGAALRDQRIKDLTRAYNTIGTEGIARIIRTFSDLDESRKAEMFDTVRALMKGGRLPKHNPFRRDGPVGPSPSDTKAIPQSELQSLARQFLAWEKEFRDLHHKEGLIQPIDVYLNWASLARRGYFALAEDYELFVQVARELIARGFSIPPEDLSREVFARTVRRAKAERIVLEPP